MNFTGELEQRAMRPKYELGAIVYLKSGGPPMTVSSVLAGRLISDVAQPSFYGCYWINPQTHELHSGRFEEHVLTGVDPSRWPGE